ncbi:unnamed protein product [Arabidopsis thaliana]|uniref:hAT-like transposase RNase-H fold domain-containing protein n=1 Tax=Arabidopsis thaliana TaxID=3702 RepID=Q9LSJ4_ARATH|nr:unnamed protein product [Arabidopsis thaliana]
MKGIKHGHINRIRVPEPEPTRKTCLGRGFLWFVVDCRLRIHQLVFLNQSWRLNQRYFRFLHSMFYEFLCLWASCNEPHDRDEQMHEDNDMTNEEFETPTSRKANKRKEKNNEGAGNSGSTENKRARIVKPHDGPGGCMSTSKVSESVWREATNELLVLDELSLAFVKCLAWRNVCSRVQMYKPHSRRTATRDVVEAYVIEWSTKKVFCITVDNAITKFKTEMVQQNGSDASVLKEKVDKYWDAFGEQVEMNRLVIVESVFDPRKKMKFAELYFERLYGRDSVEATHLSDSVYNIMTDLYDEFTRANLVTKSGSGSSSGPTGGSSTQPQSESGWSQCQDSFRRPVLRNGFLYEDMENVFVETVKETWNNTSHEVDV